MQKTFAIRIDLESSKGIKKGLPKILDLLKKYGIKASFYLVMGGESNVFELLKHRKKLSSAAERKISVFSKTELLRMAIFPKDFVEENKGILARILYEGHELGIHGWKHRAWTRGLEKINAAKHIDLAIKKYRDIFGISPESFAAPAFNTNEKIIKILQNRGIAIVSDFEGEKPRIIEGTRITNVPITIKGNNNTPIIEYLVTKGFSDEAILDYLKKEIVKKKLSIIYLHDLYECIDKIPLLEKLILFLKAHKVAVKTIKQIAMDKK